MTAQKDPKKHADAANTIPTPPPQPQPPRAVRYTSFYYYKISRIIWWSALCSLIIDPLLYGRVHVATLQPLLTGFQGILLLGAALLLFRSKLLETIIVVRNLRERRSATFSRWITAGFVLIALATLFEVGIRVHAVKIAPLFGILAVLVPIALSIRRSWREKQQRDARLSQDRVFWVETLNRNIFLVIIAPIVCARLLALATTLFAPSETTYLAMYALVLYIILAAHPTLDLFTVWCSRCGSITSRALEKFGACPRCSPAVFFR